MPPDHVIDYRQMRNQIGPEAFELGRLCSQLLDQGVVAGLSENNEIDLLCLCLASGLFMKPEQLQGPLQQRRAPAADDATLIPAPVPWTIRGVTSSPPELTVSLDSPVIHVFLAMKDDQVHEVMIVGRGVGEARRRVYDVALLSALACPWPDPEGALELERKLWDQAAAERAAGNERVALTLERRANYFGNYHPVQYVDGLVRISRFAVDPYDGIPLDQKRPWGDVDDPFAVLEHDLKRIAKTHGLVELHEMPIDEVDRVRPTWKNDGLFYDRQRGEDDDPNPLLATSVPVPELDGVAALPLSLFDCPSFRQVGNLLLAAKLQRARADAEARWEFYENERKDDQGKLDWYEGLSDAERESIDAEQIEMTISIDYESGTKRVMASSDYVPGREYYNKTIPDLVKSAIRWRDRMKSILEKIDRSHADGRLRMLTWNWLIDYAMRNLAPVPGDPQWPELQQWVRQVRPLLLHSWKSALEQRDVTDVSLQSTRRLHFSTTLKPNTPSDHRTVEVFANWLFVNKTSVVQGYPSDLMKVHRLIDRVDRLDERSLFDSDGDDRRPTADLTLIRRELDKALGESTTLMTKDRQLVIREALNMDPVRSVSQIVRSELTRFHPMTSSKPPAPDPLYAARLLGCTDTLMRFGIYRVAMQLLSDYVHKALGNVDAPELAVEQNQLPDLLMQYLYLCAISSMLRSTQNSEMSPLDLLKSWRESDSDPNMPPHATELFQRIDAWDPGSTESYWDRCFPAKGKPSIRQSDKIRQVHKKLPGHDAVDGLFNEAQQAVLVALEIHQARNYPAERTTPRRMYKLLGNGIARCIAHPKGRYVAESLGDLFGFLLEADHYLEEKDDGQKS